MNDPMQMQFVYVYFKIISKQQYRVSQCLTWLLPLKRNNYVICFRNQRLHFFANTNNNGILFIHVIFGTDKM